MARALSLFHLTLGRRVPACPKILESEMKKQRLKWPVLSARHGLAVVFGVVFAAIGSGTMIAGAHGLEGDRFFPPTITTDDPFATDELLLPSVSFFRSPASDDSPAAGVTDLGFEFDKEIFPKFALGISGDYLLQYPEGQPRTTGWDNFSLSAKYQLWENPAHEAIFSVGGEWEIGGSGSRQVGADSSSAFTPEVFLGKGLGDLPGALKYARPLAVTGEVGVNIPTSAEPVAMQWGGALEYSLPYLQSQVKDLGLRAPFNRLIPLVEFSLNSPVDRDGGPTTGTINPGILYENTWFQIGAEALIPVNRASGNSVGGIVQVQIFIDDIWPKIFGHPIFGSSSQTSGPY
jgi:hypothetical protein